MIRRTRTAKKLAQRVYLGYLTKPHPMRRARFVLSLVLPVVGLLWIGGMAAVRDNRIYSSGTLSRSHVVFNRRCEFCHEPRLWTYRRHVTDAACASCHDGPVHKVNQTFTPECGFCHREHEGTMNRLTVVSDQSCTVCHADLKGISVVKYATHISSFSENHPDFAELKETDAGTIKLSHKLHMKLKNAK